MNQLVKVGKQINKAYVSFVFQVTQVVSKGSLNSALSKFNQSQFLVKILSLLGFQAEQSSNLEASFRSSFFRNSMIA